MKEIKFKVKAILSDVNTREKDISIILTDDNSERISRFIVLNREYQEEDGKATPRATEYINTSFYNISGYNLLQKAVFTSGEIILEIMRGEEKIIIDIDVSSAEISEDVIRYLKFILKGKIEYKKEKARV